MNQNIEITNRFTDPTQSCTMQKNRKWSSVLALAFVMAVIIAIGTGCDSGGVIPPATITFRESFWDSTRVMQVTNRSGSETLVMVLDVYDKNNQHGQHVFKVKPGSTYEIGRLEMGWCFRRGESFSLKADGYIVPIADKVP